MINAVLIAGAGIWLVVVAMIFASISVYYYFKLIQAMYFIPGTPAIGELDKTYTYKLAVIAILIVVLGVFLIYCSIISTFNRSSNSRGIIA